MTSLSLVLCMLAIYILLVYRANEREGDTATSIVPKCSLASKRRCGRRRGAKTPKTKLISGCGGGGEKTLILRSAKGRARTEPTSESRSRIAMPRACLQGIAGSTPAPLPHFQASSGTPPKPCLGFPQALLGRPSTRTRTPSCPLLERAAPLYWLVFLLPVERATGYHSPGGTDSPHSFVAATATDSTAADDRRRPAPLPFGAVGSHTGCSAAGSAGWIERMCAPPPPPRSAQMDPVLERQHVDSRQPAAEHKRGLQPLPPGSVGGSSSLAQPFPFGVPKLSGAAAAVEACSPAIVAGAAVVAVVAAPRVSIVLAPVSWGHAEVGLRTVAACSLARGGAFAVPA